MKRDDVPGTEALGVTLADVQRAAEILRGKIVETPCLFSQTLSELTGAELFLKFENLQFTGSFKERGALVKLHSLTPDQRRDGVIAMSGGNHAQAVAYRARELGIPATIVMPRNTPDVKVGHTRGFGAEVILHGEGIDEAGTFAETLAQERALHWVHPFDDPLVISGQGTIALEMLARVPELDALAVPIGGGGLISGIAIAAKAIKPEIEILGIEAARFPSMRSALRDEPCTTGTSSIADGIAVKHPGRLTTEIARHRVDEILLVEEAAIERAVLLLLEVEKTTVEGAGAVGLAAALTRPERFEGRKVGLVLSGGNIDLLTLSGIIQRGLARSGRLVRIQLRARDVPGALADVLNRIGGTGASVVEIHHERAFTGAPLEIAELQLVLKTRGRQHVDEIVELLHRADYEARVVEVGEAG